MTELSLELRASGLFRDPSPHTDAPDGALREASNVVIRRAGTIEPRPGLEDFEVSGLTGYKIESIHPYQGEHILAARTGSGSAGKIINSEGDEITDPSGSSVALWSYQRSAAIAGSYLYKPTAEGLIRIADHDSTTSEYAGVGRARSGYGLLVAGDKDNDEWLNTGTVAYRLALKKTDPDGRIHLGPPSGRFIVEGDGTDQAVELHIPLLSDWATKGYTLQVYRSETNSAGEPSDELALCFEHEITAGEASAGEVILTDKIPEAERGAALYTNATQLGGANEHRSPPIAGVIESHNDMVFLGRTNSRTSLVLSFPVIPTSYFTNGGGTGAIDVTDTSTATANNDWPDSYDYSGMYITEAGFLPNADDSYFSADTRVDYDDTGGGPVWTLSKPAIGTDTTLSVALYEWLQLSGGGGTSTYYFCPEGEEDIEAGFIAGNDGALGAALFGFDRVIGNLAAAINYADTSVTALHLGAGVLVIEAVDFGNPVEVVLPKRLGTLLGADFVSEEAATGDLEGDSDSDLNRLRWSALQIPEGFPPLNSVDLGSDDHAIDALVSTGDTLFALKADGIWRIDGTSPGGLSITRISNAALMHPAAVAVHDRDVFAWLDRGLCRVTPSGLGENLTEAAIESDLREIQALLPNTTAYPGVFLTALQREGWLLLGVPGFPSNAFAEWTYVFDLKTAAITRWDGRFNAMAEVGGRLMTGTFEGGTDGVLRRARLDSDDYPHHDDSSEISYSALTVGDGEVTLTSVVVTGDDPTPGDWIVARGAPPGGEGFPATHTGTVTSFDSGTLTFVPAEGLQLGAGGALSGTVYQGPTCEIEWTARTGAGLPVQTKRWSTLALSFEELDRFYGIDWSFYTDHSETAVTDSWTRTPEIDRVRPQPWRHGYVPRDAAWSAQLRARASIHNPGAKWRLTSLVLAYQASGIRAGKRTP